MFLVKDFLRTLCWDILKGCTCLLKTTRSCQEILKTLNVPGQHSSRTRDKNEDMTWRWRQNESQIDTISSHTHTALFLYSFILNSIQTPRITERKKQQQFDSHYTQQVRFLFTQNSACIKMLWLSIAQSITIFTINNIHIVML